MASPHVAGVAAIFLQAHPGASPAAVGAAVSSEATRGMVTRTLTGTPNLLLYTPSTSTTA
jgi:subtilisin family serine protease